MRRSPDDTRPERRPLRIFAFDPMLARGGDHRVTIEIPYRDLAREDRRFMDDRLEVVDYDAATDHYFTAVDLDNVQIAMAQGLEPLEQDPQFHQQMVYAVASKVLENFDKALGRRLRFSGGDRLRLYPHAFQGRNAYFEPELNAVLFGYFQADEEEPGANLPRQLIFTCLSHDIIAHEVAHAALNRLHPYYNEPTGPQVPALHEAFADIVALFQRLTFPEVVLPAVRETRGDLRHPDNRLLDIGAQFGVASGKGSALRRIVGKPDPARFARIKEPHQLGWILVSAVFEGFVSTYERRTRDLLRLATGGSGQLPAGELHPDLVMRLCNECVRTAQSVLSMCIRATDYLPPIDPTFSDFLRAMVTADFELNRADDSGLRAAMIEAFRQHGIRPEAVGSLAVPSLILEGEDATNSPADMELSDIVRKLLYFGARQLDRFYLPPRDLKSRARRSPGQFKLIQELQQIAEGAQPAPAGVNDEEIPAGYRPEEEPEEDLRDVAIRLNRWAKANAARLGLDPGSKIAVRGFHPVHRTAANGELLLEMVAQFVQTPQVADQADLGGLSYRAAATMIANIDGRVRYVIAKPLHEPRREAIGKWVKEFDERRGGRWPSDKPRPQRLLEAFGARAMDQERWS